MKMNKIFGVFMMTFVITILAMSSDVHASSMSDVGVIGFEDADNDGYYDSDVEVLKQLISQSQTLSAVYGEDAEKSWNDMDEDGYITWEGRLNEDGTKTYQRIAFLDLSYHGTDTPISDLIGVIDVSTLDELHTLWIPGHKGVTGVQLPANEKFSYLDCSRAGVQELDLTMCPELKVLYCDETMIKELDVTKNPLLTDLICSYTGISELDVTNNVELELLSCSDLPNLSALDISKNQKLKYLGCYRTNISDIDLSHNLELEEVYIDDTPITKLDISNNTNLLMDRMNTLSGVKIIEYLKLSDKTLTLVQVDGGTIFIEEYDYVNNSAILGYEVDEGYEFVKWIGCESEEISFASDMTISAEFRMIPEDDGAPEFNEGELGGAGESTPDPEEEKTPESEEDIEETVPEPEEDTKNEGDNEVELDDQESEKKTEYTAPKTDDENMFFVWFMLALVSFVILVQGRMTLIRIN